MIEIPPDTIDEIRENHFPFGCNICSEGSHNIHPVTPQHVYGENYKPEFGNGVIWQCSNCDSYVGSHDNSGLPLGTLADSETRLQRKFAHHYFDIIWNFYVDVLQRNKYQSRLAAYAWLKESMNLEEKQTHIACFDVDMCKMCIDICKKAIRNSPRIKAYYWHQTGQSFV